MIPQSRGIAAFAILLAIATHSLALHDFNGDEVVQIAGSGTAEVAAMGSSFEDFSAGTNAPAPAKARQQAVTPSQKTAATPSEVQPATAVKPVSANIGPGPKATPTPSANLTPPEVAKPQPAQKQVEHADAPKPRNTLKPEPENEQKSQPPVQQGNSKKTARMGSTTGKTNKGAAVSAKTKQPASAPGNAQASNYAGKVRRKIMRARRKSVNIRGAALVTFRIADSGALLSVSIARSSGSKRLDQVALSQVRSAAPFPKPPASARRDYTIEIVGK